MNILLISYDYPPNKGGLANVSYRVAHQLNEMGEKIIVIAHKIKCDREFDKNNRFLTLRCLNIFFLRELALILLLPYVVLRYRIGIIYILMWCQGGLAVCLTSKFLNIPYILHAHGAEFIDYKKTIIDRIKYNLFREKYRRLVFRNAKRIIAVSKYTKDIVINSGVKEDRVNVVYNAVDIDRFRPGLETSGIILKHNLINKRILLTVSRLNEYKGHDIIIRLMPQLLQKNPDIVYIIIGSGENRDFLELLVKENHLQGNVIFTGWVDEPSLPLYYNACDIFIMLTREKGDRGEFEGFGLVFLEASSCCKPVIGARTGGITDAIADGETGYLLDPNNNQDIIDKISLLLENRRLSNKLGEQGRQRIIRENLTWEHVSKKIQSILAKEAKEKTY